MPHDLQFTRRFFTDLSLMEYHRILVLRCAVFVVEQDCPYQDVDERDPESHHVLGTNDKGEVMATARIVPPGLRYDDVSIGRVVVDKRYRKTGAGQDLMHFTVSETYAVYGRIPIRISAQAYLENFYRGLGFKPTGKRYLEDNIPHLEMLKNPVE
ncbi:MAG: GNAT family N-acetyltransferase [Cryomorphaceae bacterium]|nr:GNAT family N-acetyltransferase [Cryomorphaceae bacterium]